MTLAYKSLSQRCGPAGPYWSGVKGGGGGRRFYYEDRSPRRLPLLVQYAIIEQKALEGLAHVCDKAALGIKGNLFCGGGTVQNDS